MNFEIGKYYKHKYDEDVYLAIRGLVSSLQWGEVFVGETNRDSSGFVPIKTSVTIDKDWQEISQKEWEESF